MEGPYCRRHAVSKWSSRTGRRPAPVHVLRQRPTSPARAGRRCTPVARDRSIAEGRAAASSVVWSSGFDPRASGRSGRCAPYGNRNLRRGSWPVAARLAACALWTWRRTRRSVSVVRSGRVLVWLPTRWRAPMGADFRGNACTNAPVRKNVAGTAWLRAREVPGRPRCSRPGRSRRTPVPRPPPAPGPIPLITDPTLGAGVPGGPTAPASPHLQHQPTHDHRTRAKVPSSPAFVMRRWL